MTDIRLPIGDSEATAALHTQISRAARFDEPVLLLGETGVGKELTARAIHRQSGRGGNALQVVHCAAIGSDMLSAELFGHRAGSFTGATRDRRGRIRAVPGSTVVLDEISETPGAFQAAILRVIEQGEVQPVGVDCPVAVDARFIATSNRPLEQLAAGDGFRRDLFYRLAAFVISIPPLRARPADIEPIARHLLQELEERYGTARTLSSAALELLRTYRFPGNVRELRQMLLRAYAAATGSEIGADAIRDAMVGAGSVATTTPATTGPSSLEAVIRSHIREAILLAEGNLSAAARRLEIPRSTLQHYLVKYRVDAEIDDDAGDSSCGDSRSAAR